MDRDTHKEDIPVTMAARVVVMLTGAQECQGSLTTTRIYKKQRRTLLENSQEQATPTPCIQTRPRGLHQWDLEAGLTKGLPPAGTAVSALGTFTLL